MSLYTVMIEDRIYKVNITGNHGTVNGEEVDTKMTPLNRSGLHLLRTGKRALEVFLSSHEADTCQVILLGGRRIVTHITSRVRKQAQLQNDCAAGNLTAPMHGLVVDVPAQVGDLVEKGQLLVILESMKMQMQLRSPRKGRVIKVEVGPGSQVEKGALLVQFE
jgi:biotin carboxyl carrier protein